MRIIGGSLKGREIRTPQLSARPTTDFAKEGLFNILSNHVNFEATQVLDLFSGSGSISFEFASRGCPHITCVEMNPLHVSFIKKTALQFNLASIKVVHHNVFDFIPICTQAYDLIFADPPYDLLYLETLPQKINTAHLLRTGGLFILEHSCSFDFSATQGFQKTKRYGNVHFSFFNFDQSTI